MPVSKNIQENKHLSFTYFQSLIRNELTQSHIRESEPHLKECDRCRELSDVLLYARKIAARQPKVETHAHLKKADLTEAIARLMSEESSPREAANLLGHLGSCSRCFNYVESFFEEALSPLGENVEKEIEIYSKISLAKKVMQMRPPLVDEAQPSIKKNRFTIPSFPRLENFRLPQVAYAFVIFTVIGGFTAWKIYQSQNSYLNKFVYNDKVPYEYTDSSLRSPLELDKENPELRVFLTQFKFAMGDYLVRNYEGAIRTFEGIETTVNSILTTSPNIEELKYIRDYYFYFGVSHFALSRSLGRDLDEDTRAIHYLKATEYLQQARTVAVNNNIGILDRETYFLGLAYGFGGQPDMAVAELKKTTPTSSYYQDCERLVKQWSK